ncbi:type VII secretion target [Nocardioides jensenii]|uniref:type VII secretion target n=1 Tax=Nocardioides jensenii TaxID=1843 RepID=UPI000B268663|nr:type VII secretion target [Nocardioides jensenii]
MSGEIRVDPPSLRRLAGDLDDVIQLLSEAQQAIADSDTQADAFSPSGQPLAYAFLGAIEYAGNDAYEQADQIASIQNRLNLTADYWDKAEEAATVRVVE